jgi:hypothetical protein
MLATALDTQQHLRYHAWLHTYKTQEISEHNARRPFLFSTCTVTHNTHPDYELLNLTQQPSTISLLGHPTEDTFSTLLAKHFLAITYHRNKCTSLTKTKHFLAKQISTQKGNLTSRPVNHQVLRASVSTQQDLRTVSTYD